MQAFKPFIRLAPRKSPNVKSSNGKALIKRVLMNEVVMKKSPLSPPYFRSNQT